MNLSSGLDYPSLSTPLFCPSFPPLFSHNLPPQSSITPTSSIIKTSSLVHSSTLFPPASFCTSISSAKLLSSPSSSQVTNSSYFLPPPSFLPKKTPKRNSERKRKRWTSEEDELVLLLIEKYGRMWAFIASFLEGRTGKQIRERYFNQLDPKIIKSKFTAKEDEEICRLYEQFGPKWLHISKFLEGRTENSIKNRYYSFLRKKFEPKKEQMSDSELQKKKEEMELGEKEEDSTEESIGGEFSFLI